MAVQSTPVASSRYYTYAIGALLLLVPFLAMPVQAQADCVAKYDATVDYFPIQITVNDAALFSVRYEKNYKIVTNTAVNQTFVLTQCGTPAPNATSFANNTLFFEVPVKNVASLATTAVAFIELLGRRSTIKAVDTEGLVSSPCVQLGLTDGTITGLEDKNMTLRAEQFKSVDLVFSSMTPGDADIRNKTVLTSEVADPGPLNRAEWLEFYSSFFNLEAPAQVMTATINNNYNCFKAAANKETKPTIAWASYDAPSVYNNNTASWKLDGAAYKRILSVDAGATFFNGTSTHIFLTAAAFADAVKDVDVLIDETFVGDDIAAFYKNYDLTATSTHKFIQQKAIFREDGIINPNDGRDWFSGAIAMGDAVLQDVVRAVHPEVLPSNVPYNWLRNIAKSETKKLQTAADCVNTPTPKRAIVCSAMKGSDGSKTAAGALTGVLALLAVALSL
ncbi:hypothetical protein BGZ65_008271 [Modicella reniformis]|uniref:Periplasmic binding protein n=1 Tax=Modicella reniformis TaxID=1440133 RepID=A0A9P6IU99_9FUNG|nr:hypothetical protein BGZ65_008271 [Modicella reniformis]